ncbi:hypothetical protein [Mycolicibacterium iranicum]|uniref:Uncharacterized protein n=1 Tax=Mycolicibacterium iranicum TaxID=912594 RepID=A0A178LHR7_MYCIR|nr:hypothetical protein [Mycolicibacterium iranicum]OAN30069.1 hypothetical protein A4X20_09320 [Mycolicibacterium iranicum]
MRRAVVLRTADCLAGAEQLAVPAGGRPHGHHKCEFADCPPRPLATRTAGATTDEDSRADDEDVTETEDATTDEDTTETADDSVAETADEDASERDTDTRNDTPAAA